MFLLRFVYKIFTHPTFFIPTFLVVGAFWAATNPGLAQALNATALKIWKPEAAPLVLEYTVYALLAIAFGSSIHFIFSWKLKLVDPVTNEENQASADRYVSEMQAEWEAGRVKFWRDTLQGIVEDSDTPDLTELVRLKNGESYAAAMDRQDPDIMIWILRKAIVLSTASDAASDAVQAKVRKAVGQALRIASEQNAWLSIVSIAEARNVVRPVFMGQAKQLESRNSGPCFAAFVLWLVQT